MDVTLTVEPGPAARFGEATIVGPEHFDPAIVRSFLYIQPGDPYSPQALADAKTSIRQIPAVGSVRITEGTSLDASGLLPYQIDVATVCPMPSACRRNIRPPTAPPARPIGKTAICSAARSVFACRPTCSTRRRMRDIGRISSASRPAVSEDASPQASSNRRCDGTTNDLLFDALGEQVSTSGARLRGL